MATFSIFRDGKHELLCYLEDREVLTCKNPCCAVHLAFAGVEDGAERESGVEVRLNYEDALAFYHKLGAALLNIKAPPTPPLEDTGGIRRH
jgi:hypothetical protein